MSTYSKQMKPAPDHAPTYRTIDRAILALTAEMKKESARRPDTPDGRVARLVRIYEGVEPLLTVVRTLRLIPTNWRTALALFDEALDAVVADADDAGAGFKAGRDLES